MKPSSDIYIIPASHLDYGWAASPGECFSYVSEIIRMAIEDIEEHPDFRFTIEYAIFAKYFLEVYPEYFPRLKRLVKKGKIEICPSMSGFIEHFMDGEMVIHQLVQGKRWIRETFGVDPVTAQHTDLPGHIIQIPQFLLGCGISNFAYSRYHPPVPLHRWRAPDGSIVTACCHQHTALDKPCSWEGYGWGWLRFVAVSDMQETFDKLPPEILKSRSFWPSTDQPILMGCESDLQPSDPLMIDRIRQWNEKYPVDPIRIGTISDFFRHVENEKLPIYQGEAPYAFFALPALYTESAQELRAAENSLAAASKWSAFQQARHIGRSQHQRIDRAKDQLALPHDHNTGGRRGEINDLERYKDALHARLEGESILQEAAMAFTVNIDFRSQPRDSYPIVVFNSNSWTRSDVVEIYVEVPAAGVKSVRLTHPSGRKIPCQIIRKEESVKYGWSRLYLLFVAVDVPPLGYSTYYMSCSESPDKTKSDLTISTTRLRNRFFDIRLRNNKITSIKWNEIELSRKSAFSFNEIFQVEDKMDNTEAPPWAIDDNYTGKKWNGDIFKAEVVERGPVRLILRLSGKIRESTFTQDIILYAQLERLDFIHNINYKPEPDSQTRISYPFSINGATATYESPYAAVRMEDDEMPGTFRGHGERWVQKWIDLSNTDFGVTLATRQISHAIQQDSIEPILLRTLRDCGTIFYHKEQNKPYSFSFSLTPHLGRWRKAGTHKNGWDYNSPLYACTMTTCFPIKPIRRSRFLPEEESMFHINCDNAVITSVSGTAEPGVILIRVVEYYGKSKLVVIKTGFPVESATEVNLLEEALSELEVRNSSISLPLRKNAIHTIRIRMKS